MSCEQLLRCASNKTCKKFAYCLIVLVCEVERRLPIIVSIVFVLQRTDMRSSSCRSEH